MKNTILRKQLILIGFLLLIVSYSSMSEEDSSSIDMPYDEEIILNDNPIIEDSQGSPTIGRRLGQATLIH